MANTINTNERARRKELAVQARALISQTLPVEDADESSLMLGYGGFYLQITFSELHPLMAFFLARSLNRPCTTKDMRSVNDMNLISALGSHCVNTEAGCYTFKAAHWLDTELTKDRFLEILERSVEVAERAYTKLTHGSGGAA